MGKTSYCRAVAFHTPEPAETDRHHLYPLYMSRLLGVPERKETVNICSGCHDLVHHVLHHLINGGTVGGHRLSVPLRQMVDAAWGWWQETLLDTPVSQSEEETKDA